MGLNAFQQTIIDSLGAKILGSGESRGDFWLVVNEDFYLPVIDQLKSAPFSFDQIVDLCGVDYLGRVGPRFEVVVHLFSRENKARVRVKCQVPNESLTIPSLTNRWEATNWQEREAYDMYGILFKGHPNLERILSAPNVIVFPQRKDYPLKGSRDPGDDL